MGILARLRLAKIRTTARPNSPDMPPKRTKKIPLGINRLPEEIWCSQQISARERSSRAYMKFEHEISEGTYITQRAWDRRTLLFWLYNAKFRAKYQNQNRALWADRCLLRRDNNASRDRFRPMGARQNLAFYYKQIYGSSHHTPMIFFL